jgi:hypothetical protein
MLACSSRFTPRPIAKTLLGNKNSRTPFNAPPIGRGDRENQKDQSETAKRIKDDKFKLSQENVSGLGPVISK